MRVLLGTNIIIGREDNKIIDEDLQILMKILNQLNINIILHQKSIEDIERDKDEERKQITLSKFKTYNLLEEFPEPSNDSKFLNIVGEPKKSNDLIDDYLLYAVYRNAVNFLITEDIGIHKKAKMLDISDRILSILDTISLFEKEICENNLKIVLYENFLFEFKERNHGTGLIQLDWMNDYKIPSLPPILTFNKE